MTIQEEMASTEVTIERISRNGYPHRAIPLVDKPGKTIQRLVKYVGCSNPSAPSLSNNAMRSASGALRLAEPTTKVILDRESVSGADVSGISGQLKQFVRCGSYPNIGQ